VLEANQQLVARGARNTGRLVEAGDVALLEHDPREIALEPARRDLDRLVGAHDPVADAGEEIGDWIGHRHVITSCSWSCRGCSRCARARGGRYGTARTCRTPRAGRRT